MAGMSVSLPARQLVRSARTGLPIIPRRTFVSAPQLRAQIEDDGQKPPATSALKSWFFGKSKSSASPKISQRPEAPRQGSLTSDSIFAEGEEGPKLTPSGRTPTRRPQGEADQTPSTSVQKVPALEERNLGNLERVLNPNPHRRARWERKMVIRAVRRRGRLTKEEQIMQTERESLTKSHWFKTSIKKLAPLARQIAGKNIDEAILQMRFSKKKAAKDVKAHLEHAKNEAIVRRGMGLGSVNQPESEKPKPIEMILKSGERKTITDPSSIYISQAWVNRGPYGMDYDHRAMGRVNILRPPYTGLSVILKEEKTRIREWQEHETKALRQRKAKLWVPLPDRKITAQRQYYSW